MSLRNENRGEWKRTEQEIFPVIVFTQRRVVDGNVSRHIVGVGLRLGDASQSGEDGERSCQKHSLLGFDFVAANHLFLGL